MHYPAARISPHNVQYANRLNPGNNTGVRNVALPCRFCLYYYRCQSSWLSYIHVQMTERIWPGQVRTSSHPAMPAYLLYITLSLSVQLPRSISAYSCASTCYITLVSAFELDLYSIGLQASAPTNKAIHRVKWRHRVYGHSDTIAILWV